MMPVIIDSTYIQVYNKCSNSNMEFKNQEQSKYATVQKLHRISSVIREDSIVDSIWKAGLTAPKCALKKNKSKRHEDYVAGVKDRTTQAPPAME